MTSAAERLYLTEEQQQQEPNPAPLEQHSSGGQGAFPSQATNADPSSSRRHSGGYDPARQLSRLASGEGRASRDANPPEALAALPSAQPAPSTSRRNLAASPSPAPPPAPLPPPAPRRPDSSQLLLLPASRPTSAAADPHPDGRRGGSRTADGSTAADAPSTSGGSDAAADAGGAPAPQQQSPPLPGRAVSWQPPLAASRAVRFSPGDSQTGSPAAAGAGAGLGHLPPVSRGSQLPPLRHASDGVFLATGSGSHSFAARPVLGSSGLLQPAAADAGARSVQQQQALRSISGDDLPVRQARAGEGDAATDSDGSQLQQHGGTQEAASQAGGRAGSKHAGEGGGADCSSETGRTSNMNHGSNRSSSSGGGSHAAGNGSGRFPILRAADLAPPVPLPGATWDLELRTALARAAVENAAQMAGGGESAEPDFGYSRVVSEHYQQQQQQQLRRQQQEQEREQQGPTDVSALVRPASPRQQPPQHPQQHHQHAVTDDGSNIERYGSGGGSGGGGSDGSIHGTRSPSPAGAASLAARPPRPPAAAPRSLRSALKASSSPCMAAGAGAAGAGAASATTTGSDSGAGTEGTAEQQPRPAAAGDTPAASSASPSHHHHHHHHPHHHKQAPQRHHSATSHPGAAVSDQPHRSLPPPQRLASAPITTTNTTSATPAAPGSPLFTARRGFFTSRTAAASSDGNAASASASAPLDLSHAESVDIRIHCITFNMGGTTPPAAALPDTLFTGSCLAPDSAADAPELYVVATQESGSLSEWEAAVGAHLGRRYCRVAAESLMAIHILLFAVRPLAAHIREVRTSSVATGVGNVLGNKGGVAITFKLAGAQVLLVGSHFAAHDQHVERRNADFHRICAGLFAPPLPTPPPPTPPPAAATAASTPHHAKPPLPPSSLQQQQQQGPDAVHGTAACQQGSPGNPPPGDGPASAGLSAAGSSRRQHLLSGPTLSRFSRGSPSGLSGGAGGGAGGSGAESDSGVKASRGASSRTLLRTLSGTSTASSSHASSGAAAGALLRDSPSSHSGGFWSGLSLAAAQRRSSALLAHFDVVLWMGDLNYRIAGNPEVVQYAISHNMVEVLAANDQLRAQQRKGKVLQGFAEMPIAFAPTFKFHTGTDDYNLKRTPAWTDRVLYLTHADPRFADLQPLYYMSVPELRTSDHKPVIAGFELSISPQHAAGSKHTAHKGCVIC
ncbi:hypothetical protein Agub_g6327 [Astrephomene gubernaculifera]|uniref:Inositol polyphosphate-related phosphatase domain-containing protein n=1 Tax=Astrephomene gubernaculifera TaxID=47775 RepID=A0AAD3DSB8_9CHLO|nr:hypothetical protein Agub_g6327 [Astrephomene gubernaculifera]